MEFSSFFPESFMIILLPPAGFSMQKFDLLELSIGIFVKVFDRIKTLFAIMEIFVLFGFFVGESFSLLRLWKYFFVICAESLGLIFPFVIFFFKGILRKRRNSSSF
jgi:hypothetical protein